jgi:hypothetical protein
MGDLPPEAENICVCRGFLGDGREGEVRRSAALWDVNAVTSNRGEHRDKAVSVSIANPIRWNIAMVLCWPRRAEGKCTFLKVGEAGPSQPS